MLKMIINFIKSLFTAEKVHSNLEAFIVAGNPQTAEDIDRLERQYWEQKQRYSQFFFHE